MSKPERHLHFSGDAQLNLGLVRRDAFGLNLCSLIENDTISASSLQVHMYEVCQDENESPKPPTQEAADSLYHLLQPVN